MRSKDWAYGILAILANVGFQILLDGGSSTILPVIFHVSWIIVIFFCVKNSASRLKTFGVVLAAYAFVCLLGVAALFALMPSHGNLIDINEVIDKVVRAVTVGAPMAAVAAAALTPPRERPT